MDGETVSIGDVLLVPGAPQLWRAGLLLDGLENILKQWKNDHDSLYWCRAGLKNWSVEGEKRGKG